MKGLVKLVALTCLAIVPSLASKAIPKSISDNCPSAHEVASSIIVINGEEILRQTFTCPDGESINGSMASHSNSLESRSALETRDQILCDFPQYMTECQCGAMFSCVCFTGDVAPSIFACETLVHSVTAANEGVPTFTVQPNGIEVLTLQDCALSFVNLQNAVMTYCWDNLNWIAEAAWEKCVVDESDRVVGGTCSPVNGDYRVTLGPAVGVIGGQH